MNAALGAMVVLPVVEMVLRAGWHSGVPGSGLLVQHLTLVVGMLGGMLAARDGRLLALSTAALLPDSWKGAARWFSHAVSVAVSVLLGVAGWQFVSAERDAGSALLAHLPLWLVQAVLPAGFAAIAVRLLWSSAARWRGRAGAGLLAAALVGAMLHPPGPPGTLLPFALGGLAVATVLGAPIFVTLGGAGLILFWGAGEPLASVSVEHYRLVTNPALPSLPLFTLAGFFLAEGGASARLVRLFQALAGWFPGGPAVAATLLCAFFTAFTGGSGVTILALSGMLLPVLVSARFSERDALGLLTGAGSLGILLPPCLPVILYAIVARVGIRDMYLGGLLPGLLLIAMAAGWGIWTGRRVGAPTTPFAVREAVRALWAAKGELLVPLVALGALFGGWATPVEAAALTACCAFVVEVLLHRDLDLRKTCPRVVAESGLLVGGILLILGVALGLTNYLIDAQVPDVLAGWAATHAQSRVLVLLGLNVILLVVGSLVEVYAAIVVLVPMLVPLGLRLGLHPVHLGIIFLANMELGFIAPPFGLNILLAASRLRRPISETSRAVLPLLGVLLAGVLLITYCPFLTLVFLPHS